MGCLTLPVPRAETSKVKPFFRKEVLFWVLKEGFLDGWLMGVDFIEGSQDSSLQIIWGKLIFYNFVMVENRDGR